MDFENTLEELKKNIEETKKFLETVIDSVEEPVIVFDKNLSVKLVNKIAKEKIYQDKRPIIDFSVEEVFNRLGIKNIDCTGIDCPVKLVKKLGYTIKQVKEVWENGDERLFKEIIASPIRDTHGEFSGVVVQVHDVTEHKNMEKELKSSLSLLHSTIESTVDGILVADSDGNIVSYNNKLFEMWGVAKKFVALTSQNNLYEFIKNRVINAPEFFHSLEGIEDNPNIESYNILEGIDGKILEIYSKPQRLGESVVGRVWTFHDVTQQKHAEKRLEHLAHFDSLTGLPNRMLFMDRLINTLNNAKRYKYIFALFFLDLDRFKFINDSLGHDVGDVLLRECSKRIKSCLRQADTVARMGGDEFTIILSQIAKGEDAAIVAQKIIKEIDKPFMLKGHECTIGVSIGITLYPDDGETIDILLKNADTAMYHVKEQGKNNYQFYTPAMNTKALENLKMENALRKAITRNEFILYYQPQINIRNGTIIGVEALIRWKNPEMGMIPPGVFIPIAEETGLIVPIGEWVLKTACREINEFHNEGFPKLRVAVNLSGVQFKQKKLIKLIREVLENTGLNPKYLELELTESIAMQNVDSTITMLRELNQMGIYLSIDDFGTGYSSLSYLKRYPINKLKIDQSFVRDITSDLDDAMIVRTIVAMAHSLKLDLIAEGVETAEQLEFLNDLDCDEVQGYLFGKPMPMEKLKEILKDGSYYDILGMFSNKNRGG